MIFELDVASGKKIQWADVLIRQGFHISLDTSNPHTRICIELSTLEDFVSLTKIVGNRTVLYTYDNPEIRNIIMVYDDYIE